MATDAIRQAPTGAVRQAPKVFDKYLLPKVAFVMVTGSSLAGAVLTGLRHGLTDWPLLLGRWGTYWVLALLLGAELWKVLYLRPSVNMRPADRAVEYGEAMLVLHRRWQMALAPLLLLLTAFHVASYANGGAWLLVVALAVVAAFTAMVAGWLWQGDTPKLHLPSLFNLAALAVAAAALAGLDVALQPRGDAPLWPLAANRMLHVWAFSAWLGGALWNIFIAVPAGRVRENMDSVILANFQLERFRVVVRLVFPTIVLTGLVQAWAMFGWQWTALFSNIWGWLVLTKMGLILGLVAVFIACPMWGACSPIRGVCNLDDLYTKEDEA